MGRFPLVVELDKFGVSFELVSKVCEAAMVLATFGHVEMDSALVEVV